MLSKLISFNWDPTKHEEIFKPYNFPPLFISIFEFLSILSIWYIVSIKYGIYIMHFYYEFINNFLLYVIISMFAFLNIYLKNSIKNAFELS